MSAANNSEQQALQERPKFVSAFNDTIIRIWQEQITLLGVIIVDFAKSVSQTPTSPLVLPQVLRLGDEFE